MNQLNKTLVIMQIAKYYVFAMSGKLKMACHVCD
jgi:hypothetical protein